MKSISFTSDKNNISRGTELLCLKHTVELQADTDLRQTEPHQYSQPQQDSSQDSAWLGRWFLLSQQEGQFQHEAAAADTKVRCEGEADLEDSQQGKSCDGGGEGGWSRQHSDV